VPSSIQGIEQNENAMLEAVIELQSLVHYKVCILCVISALQCTWSGASCNMSWFTPVKTEMGNCFAFNAGNTSALSFVPKRAVESNQTRRSRYR